MGRASRDREPMVPCKSGGLDRNISGAVGEVPRKSNSVHERCDVPFVIADRTQLCTDQSLLSGVQKAVEHPISLGAERIVPLTAYMIVLCGRRRAVG